MMEVVWASPALRDLHAHFDYLAERNPAAALRMEDAVRRAVEGLGEHPYRGRPGRIQGTRELVLSGLPYVVVYSVAEVRVTVLRVHHSAQGRRG
jgi:toxin ParE1/3/4